MSILEYAQAGVMVAASVLTATIYRSFKTGSWVTSIESRIKDIEKRMDRASELLSELTGDVQGMPDDIKDYVRKEFVTRLESDLVARESHDDRGRIRDEIKTLWTAIRQVEFRRR